MSYNVFIRSWWKENPNWPNSLEPSTGDKTYLAFNFSEKEAKAMCKEYNRNNDPGRYSVKAEYEDAT